MVAQVNANINGRFKGQQYGNPAGEDLVLILGQNTLVSHYKGSIPRIVICQIKGRNRPTEVNYLEAVAPQCAPMLAQESFLGAISNFKEKALFRLFMWLSQQCRGRRSANVLREFCPLLHDRKYANNGLTVLQTAFSSFLETSLPREIQNLRFYQILEVEVRKTDQLSVRTCIEGYLIIFG